MRNFKERRRGAPPKRLTTSYRGVPRLRSLKLRIWAWICRTDWPHRPRSLIFEKICHPWGNPSLRNDGLPSRWCAYTSGNRITTWPIRPTKMRNFKKRKRGTPRLGFGRRFQSCPSLALFEVALASFSPGNTSPTRQRGTQVPRHQLLMGGTRKSLRNPHLCLNLGW